MTSIVTITDLSLHIHSLNPDSMTERYDMDDLMLRFYGVRNSKEDVFIIVDDFGNEYEMNGDWLYLALTGIPIQVRHLKDRLTEIKKLILTDLQKS